MNIISQLNLFDYDESQHLGDLERLQMVIDHIPDEKIIAKLKKIRGKGRNDWPIIPMWNSFLASFVFEHPTVSALLRELNRNMQLRHLCGFEPKFNKKRDGTTELLVAPPHSAYTNFLKNLMECKEEIREVFKVLVEYMYEHLDGFGEILAVDGKAI